MTKLHELLAAEKTVTSAANILHDETQKKFKNPGSYFEGHSSSLEMLEESPANKAMEAQHKEEKSIPTTVKATLAYALGIWAKSEALQFRKNSTNASARGTVMWKGQEFLVNLPVDQLLGLESRLTKIRQLFADIPTLDATKEWKLVPDLGTDIWQAVNPEVKIKTETTMVPVQLAPATDKHAAQVKEATKVITVGKYTTVKRTSTVTAVQKADAIVLVDELITEVKQARMRANETVVVETNDAEKLVALLMSPFNA